MTTDNMVTVETDYYKAVEELKWYREGFPHDHTLHEHLRERVIALYNTLNWYRAKGGHLQMVTRNEIIEEMNELEVKRAYLEDKIEEFDDRLCELEVELEKYDHNAEIMERLEEIEDTINHLETMARNYDEYASRCRGAIYEQIETLQDLYEEVASNLYE